MLQDPLFLYWLFKPASPLASSNVLQEPMPLSRPWHELNLLHGIFGYVAYCLPPCRVPVAILKGREALESNARDPPWRAKAAKLPMISHDKPAKKCIFVPNQKAAGCHLQMFQWYHRITGLLLLNIFIKYIFYWLFENIVKMRPPQRPFLFNFVRSCSR